MLNKDHCFSFPIAYLNSDEDEYNGLWLSSPDFSVHLTEFHKHETKYLNSDLEDTRCGHEIVVPGNMIPLSFTQQSGGSLSFWIGSEFHTLALCFAFDLPRGNNCSYVCDVRISINGFKRELKSQLFEEMNIDHLWFYYIPQGSLQQLYKDLNLGSRNLLKVLCRISCWTSESTKVPPIIRRCGFCVICNCLLASNPVSISDDVRVMGSMSVMEKLEERHVGHRALPAGGNGEFDIDFKPYPLSKKREPLNRIWKKMLRY